MKYIPTASAAAFHRSKTKVKALCGPVGSGKSSAAGWEFVLQCMESPVPLLGVVIRSSYRELQDTTRRTFFEWFGGISEYRENDETALVKLPGPGGKTQVHQLLFRSIQRPEETQKLQSLEVGFAWMEECVPAIATNGIMGAGLPKAVLDICLLRLRQKGVHRRTIVLTANPPAPSHWFYDTFMKHGDRPGFSCFRQPAYENRANLPEGYYEELRSTLSDPDLFRRFVEGEIITAYDGEKVFPEAKDGVHVVDRELKPILGRELVLGFDWGSASATATVITQILPTGQWIWCRELVSPNSSADTHCEVLRDLMHEYYPQFEYRSWGDPHGNSRGPTDAKTCFEIAASKGFPIQPGEITWQARKEAIKQRLERNAMGEPAMIVSRIDCPLSAEGLLGGYRYPKFNDGRIGYRPIKNIFSHPLDAAQYIATKEFTITPRQSSQQFRERGVIELPALDPFRPVPVVRSHDDDTTWMSN